MKNFRQRRKDEVIRQKKRNKKDLLRITGEIVCLIMFALCMAGFIDFAAGGW